MKLPNFYMDVTLNSIKSRMGIPADVYGSLKVHVEAGRLTELELERLTSQDGLEVRFDQLTILSDGTLAYKNSRVLLYIRDVNVYSGREAEPRFHLSNCTTLQKMREEGRFDRYVVSTRTDGSFMLNLTENNRTRSQLHDLSACQNCLSSLNFDGFNALPYGPKRKAFVQLFKLERFFEKYPRSLHLDNPRYNSENAPLNNYPVDWDEISRREKEFVGWKCQQCNIDLSEFGYRQYLHVHHRNGLKSDCSRKNLHVTCIGCHAEEPAHHHIKALPEYRRFIDLKAWIGRGKWRGL